MAIAKEQLRQIIAENDINSVGDIYALFKDSFKDMLQELLEAEMDSSTLLMSFSAMICRNCSFA
ncbi:MAG: hypothetical protein ACERKV_06725, partial [Clostridiaceae bacterium]